MRGEPSSVGGPPRPVSTDPEPPIIIKSRLCKAIMGGSCVYSGLIVCTDSGCEVYL